MPKPVQTPHVTPVAKDIFQVRLPLPFALTSVNCYLLAGDEGWTIVDTGLNTSRARAAWLAAFDELQIRPADIRQIVLTHSHPDHYGLSGWLQELANFAPQVYMTAQADEFVRYVWHVSDTWQSLLRGYLKRSGLQPSMETEILTDTTLMRERVQPFPEQIEYLVPGGSVQLGNRTFQIIKAEGHSDDQVVFYDPLDKLLLAGDQVLMRITPNIGLWPTTQPQPLRRYLASLTGLTNLEVNLALPGHGRIITDFRGRIQELITHHDQRLEQMLAAVEPQGVTAYEISRRVFKYDSFSTHEIRFAVAETLAHLEYLVAEGRLLQLDDEDLWRFVPNR